MKKLYYISALIQEGVPFYNFMITAIDDKKARKEALKIVYSDYEYLKGFDVDIHIQEIKDLENIKNIMLLNKTI
jgi:hypothetical protein